MKCGHVNSVVEVQQPNGYNTITGFVIRQTSVNLTPYKVTLKCPAGASLKCKHIGLLIYYVNNEESITKTNLEQEWGKPSKSWEAKYKKEIPCILSKIIGKDPPQCEIAIEGQKCLIELLDEVEESITTDFMYINLSFENQEYLATSLLIDKELGYQVHFQKPLLCASPDGIVIKNSTVTKVLEVKCPISCQSKPICDPENQKCNVPYLKCRNNQIVLSTTHQYYTNCQILMYCCGVSECDLLVYNKIDPVT
ncbi:SWIM-type domain-containing protein [Aphis craccivora]|uniref:SWIM-type domain-containing protein n=1 Tax=Aphis craccivora TaxID=307492 RepID=A0A6G0YC56_APHCR|nr:SWIM-type domain-containing protein [Aphis craccivora]